MTWFPCHTCCPQELALLREGSRRTATVICDEPTELFQVDKEDFLRICQDVYQAELEFKHQTATTYALFQGWEEETLRELCFQSVILQVPYAKVIERDWSTANYVYFVLEVRHSAGTAGRLVVINIDGLTRDLSDANNQIFFTSIFLLISHSFIV